ncbi:Uncharacterised protein [Citrobacter koseri]|uniref:Uncharacterized protein n=1 Tax=Citrobacter koseri TaxID=545 RepID=A0A2X2WVE5_CITKO|nr:Uncharacterised protein [Citrobacter koseri]
MIRKSLEAVQYGLKIKGDAIIVERYHQEKNYSDEILDVFSKFKQHDVNVEVESRHHSFGMNHIEAQVLDCVARLFPAEFHQLDVFIDANKRYRDNTLDLFEREVQFYLAVVEYIEKFRPERAAVFVSRRYNEIKKLFRLLRLSISRLQRSSLRKRRRLSAMISASRSMNVFSSYRAPTRAGKPPLPA